MFFYGGTIPSLHDMLLMYGVQSSWQVILLVGTGVLLVGMVALMAGLAVGTKEANRPVRKDSGGGRAA